VKIGDRVLVRTYSAGVHFGTLTLQDGKHVVLSDARRIWYWTGAFTLSKIALDGVGKDSKISCAVPEITLTEAIEIIPLSDTANKNLTEFPEHDIK